MDYGGIKVSNFIGIEGNPFIIRFKTINSQATFNIISFEY